MFVKICPICEVRSSLSNFVICAKCSLTICVGCAFSFHGSWVCDIHIDTINIFQMGAKNGNIKS